MVELRMKNLLIDYMSEERPQAAVNHTDNDKELASVSDTVRQDT